MYDLSLKLLLIHKSVIVQVTLRYTLSLFNNEGGFLSPIREIIISRTHVVVLPFRKRQQHPPKRCRCVIQLVLHDVSVRTFCRITAILLTLNETSSSHLDSDVDRLEGVFGGVFSSPVHFSVHEHGGVFEGSDWVVHTSICDLNNVAAVGSSCALTIVTVIVCVGTCPLYVHQFLLFDSQISREEIILVRGKCLHDVAPLSTNIQIMDEFISHIIWSGFHLEHVRTIFMGVHQFL